MAQRPLLELDGLPGLLGALGVAIQMHASMLSYAYTCMRVLFMCMIYVHVYVYVHLSMILSSCLLYTLCIYVFCPFCFILLYSILIVILFSFQFV